MLLLRSLLILLAGLSSFTLSLNIPSEHHANINLPKPFADYDEAILFPRGGGGGEPTRRKKPDPPVNWNATWDCWYHNEIIWANWEFRGENWYNISEAQLKKALDKAGIVTKWEFTNSEDKKTGKEWINASVSSDLSCVCTGDCVWASSKLQCVRQGKGCR